MSSSGVHIGLSIGAGKAGRESKEYENDPTHESKVPRRVSRHGEGKIYKHYHWISWSIIASLLYAGGFYLLGYESGAGIVAKFVLSIGFLSFSIAYIIFAFFRHRVKYGEYPWFNDTTIADPDTRRWRWGVFFLIVLTGIIHFLAYGFLTLTYFHALFATFNQGIATSVTSFGTIFLALGSFLFYKKRITVTEFVSLLVIIGGVVIMILSKEKVEVIEEPAVTVGLAIASSFFFALKNLINRYLSQHKKVDTLTPSIVQFFVDGLIGTIIAAVLWGTHEESISFYTGKDILNLVAAGWLIGFGVVFLTYAIVVGIVRPVYAIWNTVGLWHTIFAWIFLSFAPGSLEFLGLFVILFGTTLLTLGDLFINLITDDTKNRDVLSVEETDSLLAGKDLWAHRYT